MLVLSRKAGERIVIDNRIEVVVLKAGKNAVRLGFVAPDDVSIHRQEVCERIADEQAPAKASPPLLEGLPAGLTPVELA